MSRRNPSSSSALPVLLIAAGAIALVTAHRRQTGVNGVGSLFSKAKKAVKKAGDKVSAPIKKVVSKIPVVNKVAEATANTIKKAGDMHVAIMANSPVQKLVNKLPGAKVVNRVLKGKAAPKKVAGPGETVEYQDENGNVITEAEFNRRQALYEAQALCAAKGWNWNGTACVQPASNQPPTSYTQEAPAAAYNLPSGGGSGSGQSFSSSQYGGGGGGGEDATILPPAASTPEPTSVDQAAAAPDAATPAPGKLNPLVAVATFAAVPLLLGLTGGK